MRVQFLPLEPKIDRRRYLPSRLRKDREQGSHATNDYRNSLFRQVVINKRVFDLGAYPELLVDKGASLTVINVTCHRRTANLRIDNEET